MATTPVVDEVELRRLHWHCRRGLLELDLTLTRFLDRHAGALNAERLSALKELLDLGDNDLWDLVSGRRQCEIPRQAAVLRLLQEN
jgi:succinate dehydrogenase flavin-adding protein (antitoxin of CptAB toxin-antitoxin module)